MKIELFNNECLEKLKELPDNSVDCIITDPPYFISFMNKGWDKEDSIASKKEFWKECLRVTKEGGYLLAFGHSRTHHRLYTAIEDGGWEIRDTIMWLHGQGFPKGEHLKPAHEPICMARKGKGNNNLNIDDCRIETSGRYPANIILDEEAGTMLDKQTGKLNRQAKCKTDNKSGWQNKYVGGTDVKPVERTLYLDEGGASRFFYCPKVSKKERNKGCEDLEDKPSQLNSGGLGRKTSVQKRKEKHNTNVPTVKNDHPTVKPIALMEYLIKLVSKEEQTILDPFMGSGSTGMAAIGLNRNFIGIEIDEGYFNIATKRVSK